VPQEVNGEDNARTRVPMERQRMLALFDVEKRQPILGTLRDYLSGGSDTVLPAPAQRLRLSGRGTRIPLSGKPFEVQMGQQTVRLYPDLPVDDSGRAPPYDYLLFDPERANAGISHALRLRPGEKLDVSHRQVGHKNVFSHPRDAFRRHLQLTHEGDALVFRDYVAELGTYVSVLADDAEKSWLAHRRTAALERVAELFGGPIAPLAPDEARVTIREVNELMRDEPYRREDAEGNRGGLLELPPEVTPVLIGDLHGRMESLLKMLSENAYLESLERGDAALIFLGDAVHGEDSGGLEDMDGSVLVMDLIFKLKIRFPDRVFFVVGNHDSFSPDVMKGGVAQGLLWAKHLNRLRGESYRDEMDLFYHRCPLVVASEDFVACHAAPPVQQVTAETLVNVRQFPNIVHDLTWNRVRTQRFPAGYTRRHIKAFRSSLGLADDAAVIVGHYPRSADGTVWCDVEQIEGHHILYSAAADKLAVFTRVDGEMIPQVYPAETLRDWLNARVLERSLTANP
jgi:hypothetical protein